ncbi:MAG: potassium transporter TrkA [Chloroflexaceae bacterium]|nr:potassium transporter TrkA [Chloroflexaceae bacterium]
MLPVFSIIIVLILSLLITRIASVALTLTGLSQESARFQARSAFTGVGFTTTEAERVVNHPVRRRILMVLMLLGNAGIVTAMASLMLTFTGTEQNTAVFWRIVWLGLALLVLWIAATSSWIDRHLSSLVGWALKRWTKLEVRDYARVMHLAGEYGISELAVEPQDWLAEKTLAQLDLPDEGVLVLGIKRPDGSYIGAPKGSTCIYAHDMLILYGRSPVLADLDERRANTAGEQAHQRSSAEQQHVLRKQTQIDPYT